jgi:hypothetical protein
MAILNIWTFLAIIAVILFILFSRTKSAVWGGLASGIIVGLIIAFIYFLKGNVFPWAALLKGAIIGIMAGSVFLLFRTAKKR